MILKLHHFFMYKDFKIWRSR